MNTAQHRNAARDLANAAKWQEAADMYSMAIENYPSPVRGLGVVDKLNLELRMNECLEMVKEAV